VAFFLFFLDFLFYTLFDQWLIYTLLVYFVHEYLSYQTKKGTYVIFFLLLLQDHFLYGRFGVGMVYLLPLLFFMMLIRTFFDGRLVVFRIISIMAVFVIEWAVLKNGIFMQNIPFHSTSIKILLNLIVMICLTFLGTWGNRFLPFLKGKKRKVWTPNRKGAL